MGLPLKFRKQKKPVGTTDFWVFVFVWQDRPNFNENDKNYLPGRTTELQAELQELQDVGRSELQVF